jgi:hypothetical protein
MAMGVNPGFATLLRWYRIFRLFGNHQKDQELNQTARDGAVANAAFSTGGSQWDGRR